MANSTTLYVRLPCDLKQWLDDLTASSGLSLAKVTEALLADQRDRGVTITTRLEQVTIS